MQRIMFAKIELWAVLLIALIGALLTILFGTLILGSVRDGKFGRPGQIAVATAEVPLTVKRLLEPDTAIRAWNAARYAAIPTGWSFPNGTPTPPLPGYLLLSRYDGTISRHRIELVRLDTFAVVHTWTPDAEALLKDVARTSAFPDYANWNNAHFREIHPYPEPNGDLIVKDHFSPLFRIDACGKRIWALDSMVFHHSTEADAEGNLWLPSLREPQDIEKLKSDFLEDELTEVSPDGKVLYSESLTNIMLRHDMAPLLFTNGRYHYDPTHLNDIQPVLADGPYWKKGDLFLSIRNLSMVMLYRPSTDTIVWSKIGPWLSQHDVDILDDHRIAIYDNDVQDRGLNPWYDGASEVLIYDFNTRKVESPYRDVMEREGIRTWAAGQFTLLPDGRAMIEDVTDARLLIVSPDQKIVAEYMNRAEDGEVYHLGWSRFIGQAEGDAMAATLAKVQCDG